MDLKCRCPHCGTKIRYQLQLSSTLATCPGCATQFQLPDAPAGFSQAPGVLKGGTLPPVGADRSSVPAAGGGLWRALVDPMDSQPTVMKGLGKEGTLTWGFLFCVAFPIAGWLAFWRGAELVGGSLAAILGEGTGPGKPKFMTHVEVVTELVVFVSIFFGVFLLLNVLRGRRTPVCGILFTTGLVLLPLLALFLYLVALSFLKIKSAEALEVIGYITAFLTMLAISSLFLLTLASLTSVLGFTRRAGFWLTPVVLMVSFVLFTWVSKLTGEIGEMGAKGPGLLRSQPGEHVVLDNASEVFQERSRKRS